jgi:GTP-binding protein Era
MVSALKGNGVADLEKYFAKNALPGGWMYDPEQMTDLPSRMFAAEITREKLMLTLNQELPYNLMVDTETWEEKEPTKRNPQGSVTIRQIIYVSTEGHKKIIVGRAGQNIKKIGEMSRKELAWAFEKKVNLFLFVKVKENWLTNPEHYRMMGLDM